jgi:hypothetical protein
MNKQMTVPAESMADQPGVDFWRCDVKADLSMPVKRALKRMQSQQQTAKELQC